MEAIIIIFALLVIGFVIGFVAGLAAFDRDVKKLSAKMNNGEFYLDKNFKRRFRWIDHS